MPPPGASEHDSTADTHLGQANLFKSLKPELANLSYKRCVKGMWWVGKKKGYHLLRG
eukprot:SAG22_NODE_18755_length_282_cov_0.644809_1_plen_56_part_10